MLRTDCCKGGPCRRPNSVDGVHWLPHSHSAFPYEHGCIPNAHIVGAINSIHLPYKTGTHIEKEGVASPNFNASMHLACVKICPGGVKENWLGNFKRFIPAFITQRMAVMWF